MAAHRLRKDDHVIVIAGKERGKTGKILRVLPDGDRVLIERIQPLCARCNKPARIGRRKLADGRSVRVCRRCDDQLETA